MHSVRGTRRSDFDYKNTRQTRQQWAQASRHRGDQNGGVAGLLMADVLA